MAAIAKNAERYQMGSDGHFFIAVCAIHLAMDLI